MVEGSQVGLELGPERVKWDEGSEVRYVRFGVELRGEEERGLEPERVGVKWVGEEVRGGSVRCWDWIRHVGGGYVSSDQTTGMLEVEDE